MIIIIYFLLSLIASGTAAKVCDYENSVKLSNRTYNGVLYEDVEYFVDNVTGEERGCVCMKETCIQKCCPLGQGFNYDIKQCADLEEPFEPLVWDGNETKLEFSAANNFRVVVNNINCSSEDNEYTVLLPGSTPKYHLKTDGKFYFIYDNVNTSFEKYCMDNFFSFNYNKTKTIKLKSFVCHVQQKVDYTTYYVSSTCMLISCFFMVLTILLYNIIPELRTLHGAVLTTYLLSFCVGFLFLALMQVLLIGRNMTTNMCVSFTFIIYFALLAAFFWLNVLCYNLWSNLRAQVHVSRKTNRRRYLSYCAYAFGVPTVLTVLMAILEFADIPQDSRFLPRIRLQGCFLYGFSKLLYLYLPMTMICVANLILFLLIAKRISAIKKEANQTKQLRSKHRQRFLLYIELFIVTGLSWIFEVISSIYPDMGYLWHFTDFYNCLVGLVIFIIFVCKKKVLKLIRQRYRRRRGMPELQIQTSTTSSKSLSRSEELIPMNTDTLNE